LKKWLLSFIALSGLEDEIDSAAIQILSPILFLPKMDSSHPASLYSFPTSNTHNPGFPCTMCNKRVSTKDNLRRHMMRHTGEKPYACHLCNYRSIQKNHLQGHIFHNHGRTELETMRTIEIPTPGKKLGGRGAERVRNVKFPFGPYRCELCNVGFKKNDNLQRHNQKRHKDLLGSGNSVAFEVQPILTLPFPPEAKHNQAKTKAGQGRGKKRKESPSVAPHPLAYHPCPVCSKLFRSQERLRLHLLTHGGTGIRPYPCSECGKVYRQKYHLKRHVINTHYSSSATKLLSPSSTYKPTSSYLMSAGRNHHRGSSAPVSCLICARVLCNVDSLRRHILIHQGIKPFACECCGETFRQKHHVTSHMRRHTTTHSNSSMDPGVEEEGQGDKQQTKHQGCVQVGTGLGGSGNSGFMNSMVGY